nr:hypothetical protein [Salinigranum halophilum]
MRLYPLFEIRARFDEWEPSSTGLPYHDDVCPRVIGFDIADA